MNEFFFRAINAIILRSDVVDVIVSFLAQQFALFLVIALVGYAGYEIWKEKSVKERGILFEKWMLVFGATIIAWIAAGVIKDLVASPRPFIALRDANLLFPHGDHDSFPSGHATFLFSLWWALRLTRFPKRLMWLSFAGAMLVGLARVAAGIHWPLDILGGMVLGVVVVWLLFKTRKYFSKPQ
ncbi:MAG: phosphatase PAP2 family protein [Parcubacteria group bacterium]|nr:phosphatase PAP2 family protein [Parcubacteria group bacterium]